MAEILVAEDAPFVRDAVQVALEREGHEIRAVEDGESAIREFERKCPDVVILDVSMPKKNGLEVCTEIRRRNQTVTVIILSAHAEECDKILGLGLGADDYIGKPFGIGELRARVNACLRRARCCCEQDNDRFSFGVGMVDERQFVYIDSNKRITRLSPRETMLLRIFSDHPDEILPRDMLLNQIWGIDYYGNTRTLDQHIARLRQKLGRSAKRIRTVSRIGYVYQ